MNKERARFFGSSPLFATFGRQILTALGGILATLAVGMVAGVIFGDSGAAVAPMGLMLLVIAGWIPSRIEVGDDGVLVRWLGWKRFVPWADIAEVVPIGNGMQLKLKSGRTILVASSFFRYAPYPYQTARRDEMLAAVDERLRAHRASPHEAASLVARGSRSIEEWLAAIRALLSSDGYRSPSVTRDVLWRVAEDPTLDETARIGAAIALRSNASDGDKERLRIVASGTASPKVRVALDAALEATDEDLAAKLESLKA